ncbi:MAG: polysaccharide pyruvyl transferase family protein, partial [Lachnospiraceae bacterium]|nr:polysaccharide pyruvyl transferase family protein [Lachnospiraceae bacterium]
MKINDKKEITEYGKAAVMTMWFGGANYGQTLQAFAVSQITKKIGLTAYFQNYDSDPARYFVASGKNPYLQAINEFPYPNQRFQAFDLFLRIWINLLALSESSEDVGASINEEGCYCVICGGDQIWNPNYKELRPKIYVGAIPRIILPKFSYAASVGTGQIASSDREYFDMLCRNIHRLDKISVREESGKRLIEESWQRQSLLKKKISVVLDPVFMLSKEEWIEICEHDKEDISCGSFLFFYFVGRMDDHLSVVREIAKKRELKICGVALLQDAPRENDIDYYNNLS